MNKIILIAMIGLLGAWLLFPKFASAPPPSTHEGIRAASISMTTKPQPPQIQVEDPRALAKTNIREISVKSHNFKILPQSDQTWVIETAASSLAEDQVGESEILQHIDELSSIRQFKVLERTESYNEMNEENEIKN